MILSAVLVVVGLVYLFVARPHDRSDAPAGDAIPARWVGRLSGPLEWAARMGRLGGPLGWAA